MNTSASARTLARAILAVALTVQVLALGAVLNPAAAVSGPTGLAPNGGDTVSPIVFSWDRIAGATVYDVEVYDGATKLTSASVTNTVNNRWVPNYELPTGKDLTWQVRGLVNNVESDWSQETFRRGAVGAPSPLSPADTATLTQPGQPLVFSWTRVSGAVNYSVEISSDDQFVDPKLISTYITATTNLAPNVVPPAGVYYWRVTANLKNNLKSERSSVRSYEIQTVATSNGQDIGDPEYPALGQTIEDVVLDWKPIDGAATYKLQVGTDSNFLSKVVDSSNIKSTRWSPATTLDNDQYWWRVAGVNAEGDTGPWTATWNFTRRWDKQATLTYPADGSTVGDPFFFQWTPVSLASRYVVDLSTSPSFSAGTVSSCSTVHTTYTPSQAAGDCWPGANNLHYWRVKAYDENGGIISEVVNGQVASFHYDPDLVDLLAPADGASVTIPTFSWSPFPNASKYRISITSTSGGSAKTDDVVTTSYTYTSQLEAGEYRWQVQPIFKDGRLGTPLFPESQRVFTISDPTYTFAAAPDAVSTGPDGQRPPLLTWKPVSGATRYRIFIRVNGSGSGYTDLNQYFVYPSGSDINGVKLDPGTYEWRIQAYNGSTPLGSLGAPGTYTILPFATVSGYRAGMSGTSIGTDFCTGTTDCGNLRQTPLLRWDVVPGAATYKIIISKDPNLTNPVLTEEVLGVNQWMNPATLEDADALSAYYWEILPCGPTGVCQAAFPATRKFNKQGVAVNTSTPGTVYTPGATPDPSTLPKVANDVTFTWTDYIATVQATAGGTDIATPASTGAQSYRIQVASLPDFSNLLINTVVDQRTYTATGETFPEQPLYWRVAAIDGSGKALPWSSPRALVKSSPGPTLTSGHNGSDFSGFATLGWSPLAYAKTYQVQIFADGANMDIAAPLVSASSLKQNSYTLANPLPVGTYDWRVRRADADGRFGQWSNPGTFDIVADAPGLAEPANAAEVEPRGGYFRWTPPATGPASTYRLTLTPASGSAVVVTTIATSHATVARLADNTWSWKVEALDSQGAVAGTSATRSFTVSGTLTPTGPVQITGNPTVDSVLTVSPVSWNKPGTATTYQWYRGTSAIAGATGSQYTVVPADVAKAVKVRVIGVNAGYDGGTGTDSNALTIGVGPAIVNVNKPAITGTRAVGSTLTASKGTWETSNGVPTTPTTFKYQWKRNGGAISGATGTTYKLVPTDAAKNISVTVTATATGYAPGSTSSASTLIAKIASTTKVTLKSSTIKRGTRGTMYVTVTAALPETGYLRIYDGSRLLRTFTLTTAMNGKKTYVLPILTLGRHSLQARYAGNAQIKPSNSARVTLSVVR